MIRIATQGLPHPGPRNPVPKIQAINIHPAANGFSVSHDMHGAPSKQFIFHDPKTMVAHIQRAVRSSAWLRQNPMWEAAKIEKSMNLNV